MGITLRILLNTDIRSPLEVLDNIDFRRQGTEAGFNLSDLRRGGLFLESKQHNVTYHLNYPLTTIM